MPDGQLRKRRRLIIQPPNLNIKRLKSLHIQQNSKGNNMSKLKLTRLEEGYRIDGIEDKHQVIELILPDKIEGVDVVEIAGGAFFEVKLLQKVKFPRRLVRIGDGAFDSCAALVELKFPKTLKSIGENCFSECFSLKKVTFQEGFESLAHHCFYMCQALETVVLPKDFKIIASGAFKCCENLKNINLSENLEEIMYDGFAFCHGLTRFVFRNDNVDIGNCAFIRSDSCALILCHKGSSAEHFVLNSYEYKQDPKTLDIQYLKD